MIGHDVASQPSGHGVRCGIASPEHGVVVSLCALPVFVPPLSQCAHVVGRDGSHRAVGIVVEVAKDKFVVLGHRLNLEAEDAQVVHYPGHTVGHHAQIFGTDQHACGLDQSRQFLHRLVIPEVVVAAIEVVVVESVKCLLVTLVECLIDQVVLHGDARVIEIVLLAVAHKQYIADQGIEPVTNPDVLVVGTPGKSFFHFALRVKLGAHPVDVVMLMHDIALTHLLCMRAEDAVQHPVGDEGACHQLLLEVQPVAANLVGTHALRG